MNYSISEDKLNKLIYRTIDNIIDKQSIKSTSNLKFQNEDVLTKITYHYENYDELAALYFENHFHKSSKLKNVTPLLLADDDNVASILTDLFDDRWYMVFVKWFEDNFNYDVKSFMDPKKNQPIMIDK